MATPSLQAAISTLRAHAEQYRPDHQVARSIRRLLSALAARTPQPPGYGRIAEAIGRALEAADIEVTVTHDGQPSTLYSLARCLDKAGLIDWSEFAALELAVPEGPALQSQPGGDDHADQPHTTRPGRRTDRADREGHGADQAPRRGHGTSPVGHSLPPQPAVPDGENAGRPHLVDAAAPAMRKLMRRVSSRQMGADDAVDVLLGWPNRAVPDGEDAPAPLSDLDARQVAAVPALLRLCDEADRAAGPGPLWHHGAPTRAAYLTTAEVRAAVASAVPGEDVPARLDAAAAALDIAAPYSCAATNLRGVAESLRLSPPEVRAAVAAALAQPVGEQQ